MQWSLPSFRFVDVMLLTIVGVMILLASFSEGYRITRLGTCEACGSTFTEQTSHWWIAGLRLARPRETHTSPSLLLKDFPEIPCKHSRVHYAPSTQTTLWDCPFVNIHTCHLGGGVRMTFCGSAMGFDPPIWETYENEPDIRKALTSLCETDQIPREDMVRALILLMHRDDPENEFLEAACGDPDASLDDTDLRLDSALPRLHPLFHQNQQRIYDLFYPTRAVTVSPVPKFHNPAPPPSPQILVMD